MAVVPGEEPVHHSRTPSWGGQHCSRRRIQGDSINCGVAIAPSNIPANTRMPRQLQHRSVRNSPQCSIETVCELETRPREPMPYSYRGTGGRDTPFCLIGRCVKKVREDRESLILVAPVWRSQQWFPALLELLVDFPLILPRLPMLLLDPFGKPHPLMATGSRLETIRHRQQAEGISSEASQLLAAGWSRGTNSTYECAWSLRGDGIAGALNGKLIPFHVLSSHS